MDLLGTVKLKKCMGGALICTTNWELYSIGILRYLNYCKKYPLRMFSKLLLDFFIPLPLHFDTYFTILLLHYLTS